MAACALAPLLPDGHEHLEAATATMSHVKARSRVRSAKAVRAAAERRGRVHVKGRQRPHSAPFRHSGRLQAVSAKLEADSRVATRTKELLDEDSMADLQMSMDAQAEGFSKLLFRMGMDALSKKDERSAGRSRRMSETESRRGAWLEPEPEPEPERARPEPRTAWSPDVGVDAVRLVCLTNMDDALVRARLANEEARMVARRKAAEEDAPRLAALAAQREAAARRKAAAARRLEQLEKDRQARADAEVGRRRRVAADIVAAAVQAAAEEEGAKAAREAAKVAAKAAAREAGLRAAASVAAHEQQVEEDAAARSLARQRLGYASQYAQEEVALGTDISRLTPKSERLVRYVRNRSLGRIRRQEAEPGSISAFPREFPPRSSAEQRATAQLGRADQAANEELARVAELWRRAKFA